MAHISNPPLDGGADSNRPAARRHTSGSIVNPPLDGSSTTPAPAPDHDNPPLEPVTLDSASAADVLDNPRLDESSIENWFEAQLGSDTVPTVNPVASEPATPEKAGATKVSTKKPARTKPASKKAARSKAARKKAATKNVASTKRSARTGSDARKRR